MFGVSLFELIVIFIIALILFGPEQLPVIARSLGKVAGELKRASDSLRREFYNSVYTPGDDIRKDLDAGRHALRTLKQEFLAPPPNSPAPKPTKDEVATVQEKPKDES